MTNQWWTVTLRANNGDEYTHVNVSAPDEASAINVAIQSGSWDSHTKREREDNGNDNV
jgi:hypothetical protein